MTEIGGVPVDLGYGAPSQRIGADAVVSCCSTLYGSPLAELLVGRSFHPGGLTATRQLLAAAALPPGARLLDAGCGLGTSARLAAAEFRLFVDAVDTSAAVLQRAAEPAVRGVTWHRSDIATLPFEDGRFDGVLAECVLSTMARPAALAELRRVLRPGGRLLLSDVETTGQTIPGLEAHGILGAALCVTDAWQAGELAARLPVAGFRIDRRWDRSAAILEMVDRIEARIRVLGSAVRGLGLELADLIGPLAGDASGDLLGARAAELAAEVRDAVREGRLRYVACLATAVA